jgi:phosphoribosyl 1,2-cyclic phosphodiesterase
MKPNGIQADSVIPGYKILNQEASASNLSVCVLASGSKGNAVFVSDGSTSILLDAGLSGIEMERRLESRGLDPERIDAIVVSHEHSDHIQGVGVLSRRYRLPVHITRKTFQAAETVLGKIHMPVYFSCGNPFCIGSLAIHPFSISHDAADPAGFTISGNGARLGIATDLGIATAMVREHLKGCDLIVMEANHDSRMLTEGPYPWPLKQRVKSREGHLSNDDARALLSEVKQDRLKHVILAHLSEINNTHEKAVSTVGEAIGRSKINLVVARQDCSTHLIQV